MVGGEPTPWFAGAVAAVALLGVLPRIAATGTGELLDVSQLEAAHLEHSMYPVTYASMAGDTVPPVARRARFRASSRPPTGTSGSS